MMQRVPRPRLRLWPRLAKSRFDGKAIIEPSLLKPHLRGRFAVNLPRTKMEHRRYRPHSFALSICDIFQFAPSATATEDPRIEVLTGSPYVDQPCLHPSCRRDAGLAASSPCDSRDRLRGVQNLRLCGGVADGVRARRHPGYRRNG